MVRDQENKVAVKRSKKKEKRKRFPIRKHRSFQKGSGSRHEENVKFFLASSSGQWRLILSYAVQTWNILLP